MGQGLGRETITSYESARNKHGLSRDIPEPIKRQVRQRCGFGCVYCGNAIYEYHHVDPPFTEAEAHEPEGIALLCGKCHDYVTKGVWSETRVKEAMDAPKCLQEGFSFGEFDMGMRWPEIVLGAARFRGTRAILVIEGETLLQVEPAEDTNAPFQLSGKFYGEKDRLLFEIKKNEWTGPTSNWDIEQSGSRITVRTAPGRIAIKLRAEPPNELVVEQIDMRRRGTRIAGTEDEVAVQTRSGQTIELANCTFGPGEWGIRVDKDRVKFASVGDGANGAMSFRGVGGWRFENMEFGHNRISTTPPTDEDNKPLPQ